MIVIITWRCLAVWLSLLSLGGGGDNVFYICVIFFCFLVGFSSALLLLGCFVSVFLDSAWAVNLGPIKLEPIYDTLVP
jgi:hypothetical protein